MRISVVIGNPRAGGRTTTAAVAVAERIAATVGADEIDVVELAEHTDRIFEWEAPELGDLTERVAGSDVVVFACPTYKASFTGLLKAFLDRYGTNGLAGVVAVPVMLGGSAHHALAPETQLRPVLVELGASIPTRSLYVIDSEMDALDDVVDAWWQDSGSLLVRAVGDGA